MQRDHCKLQGKRNWADIMAKCLESARDSRIRAFYAASSIDESLPINKVPFVALDFETTGLNTSTDDIVSIGLVPFDYRKIYCNQAAHWLVNPRQKLGENSVVIHGITHSEIAEAPDLDLVLGEVLSHLAGRVIVVHYNRIEREFFNKALMVRLNEGICFPVVDTMAIEANFHRRRFKEFWLRMTMEKPTPLDLTSCRRRYNLPSHQAHNAMADAVATAELFLAQMSHYYSGETKLEEIWI